MINRVRIVMVETSHPGNIGATARAMKNMGLSQLVLVKPKIFPSADATARAAGADDILENTIVVDDLSTALQGCALVIGTSARERALANKILTPRKAGKIISQESQSADVALVFGPERAGLSNTDFETCHYHVVIETDEHYSSLNLAAAVQILCYEIRVASLDYPSAEKEDKIDYALSEEMELYYQHLEETLIDIGFLDAKQPKQLMRRLRRLYNRARVEKLEMNILRGILTATQQKTETK